MFRVGAWKKAPSVAVEHITDLDASDEVLTRRVDVRTTSSKR
jgi:hypothetical protein